MNQHFMSEGIFTRNDQFYNIYNPRPLCSPLQDASPKVQAEIFSQLAFEQEIKQSKSQNEHWRFSLNNENPEEKSEDSQIVVSKDFFMIQDYIKRFSSKIPIEPKKENMIKKRPNYTIQDLIYVSTTNIDFENILPGQVFESTLEIVNKTNKSIVVQILVECENPDFRNTKQYVYSIRRSHLFEFNDKHCLMMKPRSSASFNVTLKAPEVSKPCKIGGRIDISIQSIPGKLGVRLESALVLPKLVCPKSLYHTALKCNIVNFAVNKEGKSEFKLPLLFEGNSPASVEFTFYNHKNEEDVRKDFSCCVYPEVMTISQDETSMINLITKRKDNAQSKYVKKILLARIIDTSLIYSFLLTFQLC